MSHMIDFFFVFFPHQVGTQREDKAESDQREEGHPIDVLSRFQDVFIHELEF